MSVNLKSLIGKLNAPTRSALEAAAGLCLSRTHYNVEIEHYLMKLMEASDTDVARIFYRFGINQSRLTADLTRSLDKLKVRQRPDSRHQPERAEDADPGMDIWVRLTTARARCAADSPFLPCCRTKSLVGSLREISKELVKLEAETLKKDFVSIVRGSLEDDVTAAAEESAPEGASPARHGAARPRISINSQSICRKKPKTAKLDPVLGRDIEIRQIIDILMRRRQNNPILTGEAGVGKTSVVEGLALAHCGREMSLPRSKNVTVRTLDLALLQAGAGIKGEFENRLKGLIEEVKASPTPIILFIDEAHNMIGAGGQAGQNDAANLLKPALARGELRTIAATTWSEFKKYFEKDPALARRFQVVKVEEPTEQPCMVMLRGIVTSLEKHHKVRILDEGVAAATSPLASLSRRPPVARQGCQCSRYRLCAPRARPELHSARRSRMPGARLMILICRNVCSRAKQPPAGITRIAWSRSRQKRTDVSARLAELEKRFAAEVRAGRENP